VKDIDSTLTEFLCARLCHDLAGPLGAVASGVELLGDDPDPEIARLVSVSAGAAVARLRLLRAALGPAGPARPGGEAQALVRAYLEAAAPLRFDLTWQVGADEIDGARLRLVLALVMVARDALPRGGSIRVALAAEDAPGLDGLSVAFQGGGADLGAETRAALAGQVSALSPRTAPAGWAALLAARSGTAIVVEVGADGGRMAT
jgi:histidine phosphotransferase ChpT